MWPLIVIGGLLCLFIGIVIGSGIKSSSNMPQGRRAPGTDSWERMKIAAGAHPRYDEYGRPRR